MVANLMRELQGLQAAITILDAGTCERFAFNKGGEQGGFEAPDEFNMVVETIMEPVVESWRKRQMGFLLDGHQGIRLSHLRWPEYIFQLAEDVSTKQTMTHELTFAMYEAGLEWRKLPLQTRCRLQRSK